MKTEEEILAELTRRTKCLLAEHELRMMEILAADTRQAEQSAFGWGVAAATVFWVGLAWILNLLSQ